MHKLNNGQSGGRIGLYAIGAANNTVNWEMKMDRRNFLKLAGVTAPVIGCAGIAIASSESEQNEFIAGILINAETGVDEGKALEAAKKIVTAVRGMDGLIQSTLLKSNFPNNNPAFVI